MVLEPMTAFQLDMLNEKDLIEDIEAGTRYYYYQYTSLSMAASLKP